jgi:Flp pilus assembly secretin CpaC
MICEFTARMTARLLGAAMLASVLAQTDATAGPARGDDLIVKYDQSQLMHLPRAAAEIIVGNPTIADVVVQGGTMLVVTGKTFGITNIIALDAQRTVIQEVRVLVQRDEVKVVNLQRGTQRQSYNCTPQCNPSLTVGDEPAYFDTISKAAEKKIGFSERAAGSGAPAGN